MFFTSNISSLSTRLYTLAQKCSLRTRSVVGNAEHSHYVVTNPRTSQNWPPKRDHGSPMTPTKCGHIMNELNLLEIKRMEKLRKFNMPEIHLGDLVEVKYELSRTQQTYAIFQGYCIKVCKKGLNSSFSLKNAFDGIGVTQLVPYYSPRLLNVKIMKSSKVKGSLQRDKPITRDYRYRFHLNVRHRFARRSGVHKPGIRSFEIRLKNRISRLKMQYYQLRLEAGLPPYIWGGPYNVNTRRRKRLVRGETYRRIQIYGMDEKRARSEKLRKRRERSRWGNYKLPGLSYLDTLDKFSN